ncbi:MAG: twitch domain-containing radical SAM protein [Bdellovibrionia bacterium]
MSEQDRFRKFREEVLDKNSPSICAAKWNNATIWLYSGVTASCHHPPSHHIPLEEIRNNPSAIHNTKFKKEVRKQMQEGKRPKECDYCWRIEDMGPQFISDRVFQSVSFSPEEIKKLKEQSYQKDVNPTYLEIAFDRICQFACSYCNPSFSTTWVKDIQTHGAYKNLKTDKREHYTHNHNQNDPYFGKDSNPYIEAFWKWWPDLKNDLNILRITGGEPLMSPHLWRLLENLEDSAPEKLKLAINSNLGAKPELIEKLIGASKKINHLQIYTSNEAFDNHADYIRDGMKYSYWRENFRRLKNEGNVDKIHVMMTISSLCLFSIDKFLDDMMELKNEFGANTPSLTMNIVRWPIFQSPLVAPMEIRMDAANRLEKWLIRNSTTPLLQEHERSHCERLINYLRNVNQGTDDAASRSDLEKDLKRFILQYDQRRNKNFFSTFPKEATDWINSISI